MMQIPATGAMVLALMLLSASVFAGVTGKISGIVVDLTTGKPLVGATVKVDGMSLTTTTDEDGEYYIINVPVGKFDVSVTHVGFETIIQKGVRVLLDLTTPVDFKLLQVAIELNQEVVVYASEPLVKKDLTESKVIFTADRLRNLPNVITIQAVLNNYPGVVVDGDNQLHVRGGRSGQISYYYDGFSVEDPFVLNSGIRILPQALEELSLTSGGFTAEYGEALSGVVSAVTRDGSDHYRGRLRTYESMTHPYQISSGNWGAIRRTGDRAFAFDLSGPIPGFDSRRYTFFTAGEYAHETGYLPHNWAVGYTGVTKLSMQPMPNLKIKTNVTYYKSDGALYSHRDVNGVSFDFNLDGLPLFEKEAYLIGLTSNYSVSPNMVISATLNRFSTQTHSAPSHLLGTHWRDWPGYSEDSAGTYDGTVHINNYSSNLSTSNPYEVVGFAQGDRFDPTYRNRETQYTSFTSSAVNQVGKSHQLKSGFEYRKYKVFWDFKQFYNEFPYGETYSSRPTYASFFLQDKIEYRDFVVNAGLRWDHRNADMRYNATPGEATPTYVDVSSKSRLSPRLGISFPISENSVMHFNYGIYYQSPRFTYLYTNLQGDVETGFPILGNPELEPEETTSYELGLDHVINDQLRLDVTAYYKDIANLVTTRELFLEGKESITITKFENDDYGSVKGVDISLEKLPGEGILSGSLSYGYMIAMGVGSYALEPYYSYITSSVDTLAPMKEYHLDYDQRHTLTAVVDLRIPRDYHGRLFGVKVPTSWGINMVGYYGSGLPYTNTDQSGVRLAERNDGRLPANYRVDMRFNKDIFIGRGDNFVTLFVEVDNLFNRKNVLNVYSTTGKPDDDSFAIQGGLSLDADQLQALDRLYDHDPLNYSPPRAMRFGLEFNF
jgi:hypothetical protein